MCARIDVGIDAQRDRCAPREAARNACDAFELGFRLDVDAADPPGEREFDLGVAVTRLIAGGVLERYPELSFVISHFGGGLAGYKERIARSSYRFKLPKSFGDYFDRLYFDMAGFEGSPIALRCAMEGIRPERMVFATDYPQNFNNDDPKTGKNVDGIGEYIAEIQKLPLDAGVKNDMLGGTAARLLKLGA